METGIPLLMKLNGEGIYDSKPIAPYSSGNIFFTQSDDEKNIYAFVLSEKEDVTIPSQIVIDHFLADPKSKISILGISTILKWRAENGKTIIDIPSIVAAKMHRKYAIAFKIQQ